MSDDKDDLNGFDGLGKTNDDGMHFSEEELEAAMAGFEKEFQDEEAAQQNACSPRSANCPTSPRNASPHRKARSLYYAISTAMARKRPSKI